MAINQLYRRINRRDFLKSTGKLTGAAFCGSLLPASLKAALPEDDLKITKIETVRFQNGHWTWVKLYTNQGIVGVGETYPFTNSEVGTIRDLGKMLIGKDPRNLESIWENLYRRAAFNVTGGAEMRIISAINIAQWDILGQYLNTPIYQLLGGKTNDQIRVYNTTAGINEWTNEPDIEKIVKFLLDRGITAMKIWPYDSTARKNNGSYISPNELEQNLDWVKRIRDTAGMDMEIGMEFHAYWNLPCAQRIAQSLEPYRVMWLEDIMLPNNAQTYATLAAETSLPVCVSERLATRYPYLDLLQAQACDIAMFDVTWCGGITSAKKIADLADTFLIPVAPHTYGGPILWYASMHLAASLTNLFIMESGYNFYHDRYPDYLEEVVVPQDGFVTPPNIPGLGLKIKQNIYDTGEAIVESIF